MREHVRTHTHTHTTTSKPLLTSCERFDIRLPAADAVAAAANANAAQATVKVSNNYDTETDGALQRSCLSARITEENTHSSVSPGILSLSRWAFMAELCSFALLWS